MGVSCQCEPVQVSADNSDHVTLTTSKELSMEGGTTSRQDGEQFEDCLRRCNALERKLTQQVQLDISLLRQKWVQLRVDRVTNNTFKLYQVREQLKQSKQLYVEEEQILEEFTKVKECLSTNHRTDAMATLRTSRLSLTRR